MLIDLKQELFTDRNKKLYISLPLEFLYWQVEDHCSKWEIDELTLWHQLIDDFFTWICSSDEDFKTELEEEFWDSDKVVEAKTYLKSKKVQSVPPIIISEDDDDW